jgi:hypothetical protein
MFELVVALKRSDPITSDHSSRNRTRVLIRISGVGPWLFLKTTQCCAAQERATYRMVVRTTLLDKLLDSGSDHDIRVYLRLFALS